MKARQRMITQYAVAGENAGAVIGTDHAAEKCDSFLHQIWRWRSGYFTVISFK